jgi:hypothetical protein
VRIGAGNSILTWILCLAGLCRLAIAERRARRAAHSGG